MTEVDIFKLEWRVEGINGANVIGERFFETFLTAELAMSDVIKDNSFFNVFSKQKEEGKGFFNTSIDLESNALLRIDTYEMAVGARTWIGLPDSGRTIEVEKIIKAEFRINKIQVEERAA